MISRSLDSSKKGIVVGVVVEGGGESARQFTGSLQTHLAREEISCITMKSNNARM